MKTHRDWALVTFTFIWLMTAWFLVLFIQDKKSRCLYIPGMSIAFGLVIATGWYGAELVYRYGVGVESLSHAEEVGHTHENVIR